MNTHKIIITIIGVSGILTAYGIYCYSNPGTDGMIFGSVMGLIGLIVGITRNDLKKIIK